MNSSSQYVFKPSKTKGKKYDAFKMVDGKLKKIVSFGALPYQHYKDRIGLYKHLDHKDKVRRERYYQRFGTDAKVESAKWFSHNFLW